MVCIIILTVRGGYISVSGSLVVLRSLNLEVMEGIGIDDTREFVASTDGMALQKEEEESLVGKHLIYTYENGWEYEVYYKNKNTIDYRVLRGMMAGRYVKGQRVHMRRLSTSSPLFMVSWTEPTGTCVAQVVDLDRRSMDTVAFFPCWVAEEPSKTTCFQNNHLPIIVAYRDIGPTYPISVVNETGFIHTLLDSGPDNELLIS